MELKLIDYSVLFGDAAQLLNKYLQNKDYSSVNILIDNNTEHYCLPKLKPTIDDFTQIRITPGERNKTLSSCEFIWGQLQSERVDRHALLINLGGGVIGDMGGFVASTYMRGIDFIHIPTTLLSQIDASVGGKLGVDFNGYKNFVGLFQNPQQVIIDSDFISTLPESEVRSGFAEMIKHALIKEKSLWDNIVSTENWKDNLTNKKILESVNVKREVVLEDPLESGLRKILNFGHTIGHALETYSFTTTKPLLHGEAIALGMIAETYLSHKVKEIGSDELDSITHYIKSIYEIDKSEIQDVTQIIANMKLDKKNKNGRVLFSLLNTIGDCAFDVEVSEDLIMKSIKFMLT